MISLGFIDENFEMVLDHLSYSSTLICQISKIVKMEGKKKNNKEIQNTNFEENKTKTA